MKISVSLVTAVLLTLPAICQTQAPASYTIGTAAGNGINGYAGDGGSATDAEVNYPMHLVADANGNIFIADQFNHRIRKMAADGTISTVAGNGTGGYAGDAGAATSAELYYPCGVAVDSAGNIFIADTANHRIRKVSTSGTITTVVGDGTPGYIGDGGPGSAAELNGPLGLALDAAGNLYIGDVLNNVVRKLAPDGTISTVAGTGTEGEFGDGNAATSAELNRPEAVAVDSNGNLYIADSSNNRIRKVTPDGIINTIAGIPDTRGFGGDGGPAVQAELDYPDGIVVDTAGNLYISDSGNFRIRVVSADGTITTIAGDGGFGDRGDGGPARAARLRFAHGVAVDRAGNIYVADTQNGRVRRLTAAP